jgi:diaminohydroxyphosphoribosylaminopyrimidine deaminase / 5-amino-6-(5-phosphoribosylamino)uracil reductase
MTTALDIEYMARALRLAHSGRNESTPNPSVGCVLVKGDKVIGEGYTQAGGVPHAEVHAIQSASEPVDGCIAYVTLEPCSHQGKSPPCSVALIEAGVSRVVVAMTDVNPLVSGQGIKQLRAAGISVDLGVLEAQARAVNPGFNKRMTCGMPRLTAKLAMSLDGRTAMASGQSQWITGPEARDDVQRLRARSCAIVSGVDTVIVDDAALTVRKFGSRQPLRMVLDSRLRLPVDAKILQQAGDTCIAYIGDDNPLAEPLQKAGAELVSMPADNGRVDLAAVMKWLAERQCNEVLLECGPRLAGAMLEQQLIDELVVYMAPILMGSNARPLFDLPLAQMSEKVQLDITEIRAVGDDWRIRIEPRYTAGK